MRQIRGFDEFGDQPNKFPIFVTKLSPAIHEPDGISFLMEKIRHALSINFDAIEPTAGGYRVSNSSNPEQKSVWLSKEEWLHLCRLAGWVSDGADHGASAR